MKHRVSISTLRRKIKSTEIQFRLDEGKYMILDSDEQQQTSSHQAQGNYLVSEQNRPSLKSEFRQELNQTKQTDSYVDRNNEKQAGESVITAANRLLADLKKAYTQVLQDKESQISDLREEIMDLRTLVKVLESENDRLKSKFNN